MFARFMSSTPREPSTNPSQMQPNEALAGYAVAAVLAVVAVLNLAITTGAGAPKHTTTWTSFVGLGLAVGLAFSLRFRNRLASPFIAIFAGFFVTLSKGPKALTVPHIIALVVAVGFALLVSMRQRKDQRAIAPSAASDRRAAADARRRRRKGEPEIPEGPKRPAPNSRYTPPKSRTTPKR
jgi:hypothetical protein